LKIIVIIISFLSTIDEENSEDHVEEEDQVELNVEEQQDNFLLLFSSIFE